MPNRPTWDYDYEAHCWKPRNDPDYIKAQERIASDTRLRRTIDDQDDDEGRSYPYVLKPSNPATHSAQRLG